MQQNERNSFSKGNWKLTKLVDLETIRNFDCGDPDLNEYFQHDASIHRKELLTETYCLKESTEDFPIALISLCNDAVRSDFPILKEWIELHLTLVLAMSAQGNSLYRCLMGLGMFLVASPMISSLLIAG